MTPEENRTGETQREPLTSIVDDWRQRLRSADGDERRTGERGKREQDLVRALLRASDVSAEEETVLHALAVAAAAYGEEKHRERLDPSILCWELAELRNAVWDHFKQLDTARNATEHILRFDRALSIAVRATISGGVRCELEKRGQWPAALQSIVHEASKPNDPSGGDSPAGDPRSTDH
jgi:hypothetical protein